MPRELVHWHVVTTAASRLESAGANPLAEACRRYPELMCLGSVAHDAPYYYRMGEDPFEAIADVLHAKDAQDSLDPMRALVHATLGQTAEQSGPSAAMRQAAAAFLFGMLSHIAADTQFHPLVFYVTGNYHDPHPLERALAQGRHRLFETYLDSWIRPRCSFAHGYSIGSLLDASEAELEYLTSILETHITPEQWGAPPGASSNDSRRWYHAFRAIAKFQTLFLSSAVGALVRVATLTRNPTVRGIDALFSFARLRPQPYFDSALCFLNPVSGVEECTTTEALLEQSVLETIRFGRYVNIALEGALEPGADPFPEMIGGSLNFGIPQVLASSATYYSPTGAPLPGLTRGPAKTPKIS